MEKLEDLKILLADDDEDDCLFFKDAIDELAFGNSLVTVNDGEQLMQHLEVVYPDLPNALFLDLNMPRKNGYECLSEIKSNETLKNLPVIIFSTSYDVEKANQLYNTGANYYICKPHDFEELKKVIQQALQLVKKNNGQPTKENFYLNKL